MTLPSSPDGYKVDAQSGEVHTRYASHAKTLPRTRSELGARGLLNGRTPDLCVECFPPPPEAVKPKAVRRYAPRVRPEPAIVAEPTPTPDEPSPVPELDTEPAQPEDGAA